MHGKTLVAVLVAALALLGLSRDAAAMSTGAYYELNNQNSQTGNSAIPGTWVTSATAQPVSTGLQSLGGKTEVTAAAAPGVLKASIWQVNDVASIALTGVSDTSSSHAAAQFIDWLTLTPSNPALIGTQATVTASLRVDGGMLADYFVQGNNSSYFDVYGRTTVAVSGTGITGFVTGTENQGSSGGQVTSVSQALPGIIPIQFNVPLGVAISIQYQLDLQAYSSASFGFRECGGGYGPCGALASALVESGFANSVLWNGITSITDAGGSPIPGIVASSGSGFDYMTAVPEPGTAMLLAVGTACMGLARRPARSGEGSPRRRIV